MGALGVPRDPQRTMIGYRRARKEREGRQRAHLQWCVLYSYTDSAINHRDSEKGR